MTTPVKLLPTNAKGLFQNYFAKNTPNRNALISTIAVTGITSLLSANIFANNKLDKIVGLNN